ncbi:MAG: hypothetical protein AABZ53_03360 [Planctomycetota bacterium]
MTVSFDNRCRCLAAIVLGAVLAGCCCPNRPLDPPLQPIPSGPAPTVAQIATRYNARVRRLERFSATTEVQVKGTDAAGAKVDESFDGVLKVERPAHLSMRGHKAGVDAFILGSSDTQYWWIDLYNKPLSARVGSHEGVGLGGPGASKFQLPMHPLDFIELLGITPINPDPGASATTRWLGYGTVELTEPTRFGKRKIAVAFPSCNPLEVTLLDRDGRVTAHAELKEMEPVRVTDDAAAGASVPTRLFVSLKTPALGDLNLIVKLYEPENKEMNPKLFDLRFLLENFGVEKEFSLDAPLEPTGGK